MLYVNYIPKKNKLIHIYFQVALGVKNSPDKAGDLEMWVQDFSGGPGSKTSP